MNDARGAGRWGRQAGATPRASLVLLGVACLVVVVLEVLPAAGLAGASGASEMSGASETFDTDAAGVPPTGAGDGHEPRTGEAAADDAAADETPGDEGPGAALPRDGWTGPAIDRWEGRGRSAPIAMVDAVTLYSPVTAPVATGFHEASTSAGRAMWPLGPLLRNDNTTRFTASRALDGDAPPYVVLSSRGRSAGPTSAVDVVARPGDPVVAPITGVVTDVRAYALYGRYADERVEIRSHQDPTLRAVIVHVSEVSVEVGDRVFGGTTPIAGRATGFPFASQIDRETEPDRFPHVHVEVQPADARRPGDPPPESGPGAEPDPAEREVADPPR